MELLLDSRIEGVFLVLWYFLTMVLIHIICVKVWVTINVGSYQNGHQVLKDSYITNKILWSNWLIIIPHCLCRSLSIEIIYWRKQCLSTQDTRVNHFPVYSTCSFKLWPLWESIHTGSMWCLSLSGTDVLGHHTRVRLERVHMVHFYILQIYVAAAVLKFRVHSKVKWNVTFKKIINLVFSIKGVGLG